ncbi:alanyl-tRNA synthetase [Panacagrimonas perspica]|uniref:Alanine--tRNA ligase n=1 Tax=Panacagrimonas perspica TaxID=381431 RepID=A0A4R7P4B0_9GAMM|nr:alanine--tRNA ligase [Panacagrimonas perspica]TDU28229.1 alanyl-tRNA synthetase [Panacagrimonas perspica]THD01309.1 alanine--tRNA ligase [Panacagrimonas perspica]
MNSNELRAKYLEFFRVNGHTVVPSSPLVPGNDPTLLFTNAGMVQFKDVFTGQDKRPYVRATSSQKCVRAGGKHNDLENVGYTARHHTFFEMLGNFSFGDYFKPDAIRFGWEFVTGKQWLGIDPKRLLVTVYHTDDEAFAIWKKVGVPEQRIIRIGDNKGAKFASDNFWAMGDTGPCGPCTEMFYDHDPDGSKGIYGGPPGSPEEDGDRWIEIWNHVFMQFERAADGTMTHLPAPSVDTGMGLERVAALMQGTNDNYQTDTFKVLVGAVADLAKQKAYASPSQKVIADHIRATSFLIADGVLPSNEGRGYVLRRIMRRALRHGHKLGITDLFFNKLVAPLVGEMGNAFPELVQQQSRIEKAIRAEEDAFATTLDKGMKLLEEAIGKVKNGVIPGDVVFKLYDTYGFPFDLTADIARERSLKLDEAGYESAMEEQRTRARAASSFKGGSSLAYDGVDTVFVGYDSTLHETAKVLALYRDGQPVTELKSGDAGVVVLDHTPFYAESGGQVGDKGLLLVAGSDKGFKVADTQKVKGGVFGHHGTLEAGALKVGDTIRAEVTDSVRRATMRNHSATHLMHKALRDVLGTHVAQKGSLVDEQRTRFDFSHTQAVTAAEIADIEDRVNRAVLANVEVGARVMKYDDAIKSGAMALFGEKYGDEVRVLAMGDFSTELCGGTHVTRTGDIGLFKIVSETGVAAGVRRVEAITGENALAYLRDTESKLKAAGDLVRAGRDDLADKIQLALDRSKTLEKELAALKSKLASSAGGDLASQAREIKGVKVIAAKVDGVDGNELRNLMDQLKDKLKSGIVLLGSATGPKVSLIAGVTSDLIGKVKAGELVSYAASQVGGKGGGKPEMAQAGGTQPEKLPEAIESAYAWLEGKL